MLGAAAAAAAAVSGAGGATPQGPTEEVIVTLKPPGLAAFGRSLASARHAGYARELAAAQAQAARDLVASLPGARIRWRYRVVLDGFAIDLPRSEVGRLAQLPGVARLWPNLTYHSLSVTAVSARAVTQSPELIGADKLWGPTLATAGAGMKIGIIDDGIDATHPFFDPSGYTYPPGFPKGLRRDATPKVIVQRTFAPPSPHWKYARAPFDPTQSFHATHVAGIAAGDHGTADGSLLLSGVAPSAYLGNYKALTIPTPDFGLDGNSAQIAAAIDQAVRDGMNVINLSLGEPEVAPSRDVVVQAIEGAARAGVVPVVAAGNDFNQFGYGSISSPANAPSAITVAATTIGDQIADFSSAGPTPVSLILKPDVSAPGVAITSSLPTNEGGPWGELGGTSMATPIVSGGVALLKERHPAWTVAEIKSAIVATADPVRDDLGREISVLREGGGLIDLPKADNPLLFTSPSSLTFPLNGGTRSVALTDAGGGAGSWSVSVDVQDRGHGVTVSAPPTVAVPGTLPVTATAAPGARSGLTSGFVVLTRGTDVRRIPFLAVVDHPLLRTEPVQATLTRTGTYAGDTRRGEARVSRYRFPTGGDATYPGPEVVYRVRVPAGTANFGVAVLSGHAVPHVVEAGDENHLTGYDGLPQALNPYFSTFGEPRPVAGAVLPTPGAYDVVFDTRSAAGAGPFTFRFWIDDTAPPVLRLVSARGGRIVVSVTDAGSGVDPQSLSATLDGRPVGVQYAHGLATVPAKPGAHTLTLTASDFQELKNQEDVARIKPNTATLSRAVRVAG
ncbi:MAG TPA: S8 family serine peptidase [Gaiellaceae bacterium]|nr:S8 family serine peptidase [Gaiellaceae bacterium]